MKLGNQLRKERDDILNIIFRIVLSDNDATQFEAMRQAAILVMRAHELHDRQVMLLRELIRV